MKLGVDSVFPYGLTQYNEKDMEEIGLEIIHIIQTAEIEYNTTALKELFVDIDEKCVNSHVWALYGFNDQNNWIPFQVASRSSKSVISEIKTDFLCMTSFDENRDLKNWNSYFYKSVMEMKYGFDTKCQKHRKMKEMCNYLAVTTLSNEQSLVEAKDNIISKYQKKECDIALKIKPLFWNPAGKEFTYINSDLS